MGFLVGFLGKAVLNSYGIFLFHRYSSMPITKRIIRTTKIGLGITRITRMTRPLSLWVDVKQIRLF